MKERERLISLAIKYGGNYNLMKNAISVREEVEPILYDKALTIFDDAYPRKLLDLREPPLVLFYKGDLSLLKKASIGVVGTRTPCDYSKGATKLLVLKNSNKVVVSGLSKGIAAVAHKHARKTIAVLGCGIDYIYPSENKELFDRIARDGLIISEYPFMTPPMPANFVFRNRIIAGLSDELCIMEVKKQSGSLSTINTALELGKDIKVLPFDIFKKEGEYNNYLINEGANLVTKDDLLDVNSLCF